LTLARPILAPLAMSILFRTAGLVAGIALLAVAGWAVLGAEEPPASGPGAAVPNPAEFGVGPIVITLVVLSLVKGLARYLEQYCGHYVAFRVLARLRLYFYDRLAPQAPAAVEGSDTGDLLSRVTKDVDRVEVFFAHTIGPAVTAVVVPVGTVVFAAVVLGPAPAAVLAVGLAVVGLATPAIGRAASARGAAELRQARGQLAGHVRDSVQGVREVLAFGAEGRRLTELEQAGQGLAEGLEAIGRANALRRGANLVAGAFTLIAQLLVVTGGEFSAAQTGLALGLTVAAFAPVLAVEDFAADLQQAYASARRIFAVTDAVPLVSDPPPAHGQDGSPRSVVNSHAPTVLTQGSGTLTSGNAEGTGANASTGAATSASAGGDDRAPSATAPGASPASSPSLVPDGGAAGGRPLGRSRTARALSGRQGEPMARLSAPEVRFDRVAFRYPGAARNSPALIDVSLTAEAGQVTAIVGASGSGKSTLAALLTRSWDPDQGAIYLGGKPLPQYSLDQLRAEVAVSAQRPYLFNMSIEDNLRLGRPGATEGELERAASAANFDAVVVEREAGWQAPVGEMGELLSGGQRQRLALARTVLRDPSVLVLDEATSQLDHQAEAEVLRRLGEAWSGKTVIVIAHRLSTVKDADRVYVMDAGRIVQRGVYASLAAVDGPFADLLAREEH
jgi:ABC-type multidrug transport system fused ATPase/permease subunit